MVEAVATRDAGETALAAFRRHLLGAGGLLDRVAACDTEALRRLRTVNRVIAADVREQAARAVALLEDGLGHRFHAQGDDHAAIK